MKRKSMIGLALKRVRASCLWWMRKQKISEKSVRFRWSVGTGHFQNEQKLPESWLLFNHNDSRFARFPKDPGTLPALNWTKNQMVCRARPARKTRKMDRIAGCDRGTTDSNSSGYLKMQGCSLREIERKIGWSVGIDQQKSVKKWPDSWLLRRLNTFNFPSFARDSGMVPARNIRWSVAHWSSQKMGNWPESWLPPNSKSPKLARFPNELGMLPAQNWTKNQVVSGVRPQLKIKNADLKGCCRRDLAAPNFPGFPRTQGCPLRKNGRKIRWSVGHDQPGKREKWTWEMVVREGQTVQIRQVSQRCRDVPCVKWNEK